MRNSNSNSWGNVWGESIRHAVWWWSKVLWCLTCFDFGGAIGAAEGWCARATVLVVEEVGEIIAGHVTWPPV